MQWFLGFRLRLRLRLLVKLDRSVTDFERISGPRVNKPARKLYGGVEEKSLVLV